MYNVLVIMLLCELMIIKCNTNMYIVSLPKNKIFEYPSSKPLHEKYLKLV